MKCKNCEFCNFIEYDGYVCERFDAYIPFEIVDKDLDCMVYDYDTANTEIFIDEDGCKNIKTYYHAFKSFGDIS